MNISKELIEKAKTAKSAEELLEMAKAENIELSAEQAAKALAELHKAGELSVEELDNVAGGCSKYSPSGAAENKEDVVFLYEIGQEVEVYSIFSTTKRAVIIGKYIYTHRGCYCPGYRVRYLEGGAEDAVPQTGIEQP